MRNARKPSTTRIRREVALQGRRRPTDTPNSLTFLVEIEGVPEYDGTLRGANGIKWRIA